METKSKKHHKLESLNNNIEITNYVNHKMVFDKILNQDVPLDISPWAIKLFIHNFEKDDVMNKSEEFKLATMSMERWDRFHNLFKEYLSKSIADNKFHNEFKNFKRHFICFLIKNDSEIGNVFLKFGDLINKWILIPEINSSNLGSSFGKPNGKGSNYLDKIFFKIYSIVKDELRDSSHSNDFKIENLINSINSSLSFSFLFDRKSSDSISDMFFVINEDFFKKYTNLIFDINNVSDKLRSASEWFELQREFEKEHFDLTYLIPSFFLRTKEYLNQESFYPEINKEKSNFTNEVKLVLENLDVSSLIEKFSRFSTEEDLVEFAKKLDENEYKRLKSILDEMSNNHYDIENMKKDVMSIMAQSAPSNQVDLCKDDLMLHEDKINKNLSNSLNMNTNEFIFSVSVAPAGDSSSIDILVTCNHSERDETLIIYREERMKVVAKYSSDSNDPSDFISTQNNPAYQKNTVKKTCESQDKALFLKNREGVIIIECKKIKINNLFDDPTLLSKDQAQSYVRKLNSDPVYNNSKIDYVLAFYIEMSKVYEEKEKLDSEKNKLEIKIRETDENDLLPLRARMSKIRDKLTKVNQLIDFGHLKGNGYVIYSIDCLSPSSRSKYR